MTAMALAAWPSCALAGPGDLTPIQSLGGGSAGIGGASDVAVAPDGGHVYVAAAGDGAVTAFERVSSGRLDFVASISDGEAGATALAQASGVAISPDGQTVYVAAVADDAVTAFDRDRSTGELTFVEAERDEVGGVVSLDGAHGVVVSPDGAHVYVASVEDSSVTVFSRDGGTGALVLEASYTEPEIGDDFQRLDGALSLAVRPDRRAVYVVSLDDAVTAFSRDTATGLLEEVNFVDGATSGADAFLGASALALTPDGRFAYVASIFSEALAANRLSPLTGALSFADFAQDGKQGIQGLGGAADVVIASDGTTAHVAASRDHAISSYSLNDRSGQVHEIHVARDSRRARLDGVGALAISPNDRHLYAITDAGTITALRRTAVPIVDQLRAPKRQPGPKLVLGVRCSRACDVRVSATGRADGRAYRAQGARSDLRDGKPRTFRLELPARTDRKAGPARIVVRARDAFGGKQRLVRRVRLTAP